MNARLVLHCGCQVGFAEGAAPRCPVHGAQAVVRVLGMPKPRIRGCAAGPLVQTEDLAPFVGRLTGGES